MAATEAPWLARWPPPQSQASGRCEQNVGGRPCLINPQHLSYVYHMRILHARVRPAVALSRAHTCAADASSRHECASDQSLGAAHRTHRRAGARRCARTCCSTLARASHTCATAWIQSTPLPHAYRSSHRASLHARHRCQNGHRQSTWTQALLRVRKKPRPPRMPRHSSPTPTSPFALSLSSPNPLLSPPAPSLSPPPPPPSLLGPAALPIVLNGRPLYGGEGGGEGGAGGGGSGA